ncbi:hypothetical protein EVJ58_g7191 [Rhodofomes roseus]|uniref:Uncharacterized protein n=1 Tax=Rhodofomes roseus TaxID=34475 RepID=A0A4Y9Y4P8_9APHY|nr:hypothetical protein EVJ58_g7191 [Rhodofomes roseus]
MDTILGAVWQSLQQSPPPNLREILDAYRAKGDGDRDMLIAMLNAKSAEDQVRLHLMQPKLGKVLMIYRAANSFSGFFAKVHAGLVSTISTTASGSGYLATAHCRAIARSCALATSLPLRAFAPSAFSLSPHPPVPCLRAAHAITASLIPPPPEPVTASARAR